MGVMPAGSELSSVGILVAAPQEDDFRSLSPNLLIWEMG